MRRLLTMVLLAPSTLLIALAALGCGDSGASLENVRWILTEYAETDGSTAEALGSTEVDATFVDGNVSGTGGCNTYRGGYEADGASLSISPVSSTMMACDQPILDQETAFFAAMSAVASYEIENNNLVLMNDAGDTILVFSRSAE